LVAIPLKILKYTPAASDDTSVRQELLEQDNTINKLKVNLAHAQNQMKVYSNGKRKNVQLSKEECFR